MHDLPALKLRFPRRLLLSLWLILGGVSLVGQEPIDTADRELQHFPHSWTGIWKGDLEIYNQQGKQQSLPMQLHIQPLDTAGQFSWTIIYGPDPETGRRPYVLKTLDADWGHYLIDEQNSIAMEAYLLHNKLFSRFSVMDNLLLSTTEMRNGQLIFEIISGSLNPVSRTGETVIEGEQIPAVEAFPIIVLQRAVLTRE